MPSIRALRAEHLPLLKNIRQECKQVAASLRYVLRTVGDDIWASSTILEGL